MYVNDVYMVKVWGHAVLNHCKTYSLSMYAVIYDCSIRVFYKALPIIGSASNQSQYWGHFGIGYLGIPIPINSHSCQLSSS